MSDIIITHLEKRGRFTIQEVTERKVTKIPERIRHDSISSNKKFFFTKKSFDNCTNCPIYIPFVFDSERNEWISFNQIWEQYQRVMNSSNNSFEKVFQYVEKNEDNSSDSISKLKTNDDSCYAKKNKNSTYKELVQQLKMNGFLFNPIKRVLRKSDQVCSNENFFEKESTASISYIKEKRKKKYIDLFIQNVITVTIQKKVN